MKKNAVRHLLVTSLFVLAILWSGCTPSTEEPAPEVEQLYCSPLIMSLLSRVKRGQTLVRSV